VPPLCDLACAIVVHGLGHADAVAEAVQLASRASSSLSSDPRLQRPTGWTALASLVKVKRTAIAKAAQATKAAPAALAAREVSTCLASLGDVAFVLEARGAPSSACEVGAMRLEAARVVLSNDSLRLAQVALEQAQALLRAMVTLDGAPQPSSDAPDLGEPHSAQQRAAQAESSAEASMTQASMTRWDRSPPVPAPSRPPSAARSAHAAGMSTPTRATEQSAQGVNSPQANAPQHVSSHSVAAGWREASRAWDHRSQLRVALGRWYDGVEWRHERDARVHEREARATALEANAAPLARRALRALEEAGQLIDLYDYRRGERSSNAERELLDGELSSFELHTRLLLSRAEAHEACDELLAAAQTLQEVCHTHRWRSTSTCPSHAPQARHRPTLIPSSSSYLHGPHHRPTGPP
jgi:hypothetical protein